MRALIALYFAILATACAEDAASPVDGEEGPESAQSACSWSQWSADGVDYHVCDAGSRVFACEVSDDSVTWRYYAYGVETGPALAMSSMQACIDRAEAGARGAAR